jgi:hypothetical protein
MIDAEFLNVFFKQIPFMLFIIICYFLVRLYLTRRKDFLFDNFRKNYQIKNLFFLLNINIDK